MPKTKKAKTKCVIYARVSESRTSADSMSCVAQTDKCKSYADAGDLEVLRVFHDNSLSGKEMVNRPGLQKAIELACKQKAVLLCYSLSRIARSIRHLLAIADELERCGADFACVKERFDTSTSAGKLIFHIFAALQQFEREQISQRTSDAMLSYIAAGRKMSSRPCFGYKFEGDQMIEDPDEQRIMRRMGELRRLGLGWRSICNRLLVEGYKPRGASFSKITCRKIVNAQGIE